MRRAKLGDLYYIQVPNGKKLFQWAYRIPRKGDFIRVFDGLYQTIPNNLEEIVNSQHSYIIAFYVTKANRIGLAHFLGNYAVPVQYPFPPYQIRFDIDPISCKLDSVHVMNSDERNDVWKWFDIDSVNKLPLEYQGTTLLNSYLTPNWLLYLFDVGFDLQHPERYRLGDDPEGVLRPYTEIIEYYTKRQGNCTD